MNELPRDVAERRNKDIVRYLEKVYRPLLRFPRANRQLLNLIKSSIRWVRTFRNTTTINPSFLWSINPMDLVPVRQHRLAVLVYPLLGGIVTLTIGTSCIRYPLFLETIPDSLLLGDRWAHRNFKPVTFA